MDIKELAKKISKNLDRSIVIYDLETSSLPVDTTEILQFWGIRIEKNGKFKELTFLSKPLGDIDPRAEEIHGLSKDKLAKEKPFSYFAPILADFFKDADLGGYNIEKFDSVIMQNQMKKYGFDNFLEGRKTIDSYKVYLKHHDRKLASCLRFYTNEVLENAHDASADGLATIKILASQLERENLSVSALAEKMTTEKNTSDSSLDKYLVKDGKDYVLNFSKHKGKKISECEISFLKWLVSKDFPECLKTIIKNQLSLGSGR